MSTIALALAACRAAPTNVVFEMPDGFTGAFVLRRNAESVSDWRTRGDTLVVEIKGAATEVRSFEPVEGKYLKYEARLKTGTLIPLVSMAAAKTHEGIGLFGGSTTSGGEMHFFLGGAKEAVAYFDRLSGK